MDEGNQIRIIGKILGAASMNIGAVVIGIDPSTEVAAQCIEGRSFGKYLVFHATPRVDSRYEGMCKAFGEHNEILQKPWLNDSRGWLSTSDYDKLVEAVGDKRQSTKDDHYVNERLVKSVPFHVIRWGLKEWGPHIAGAYTSISLLPMFLIALARWMLREKAAIDIIYAGAFMLIAVFDGLLLDIKRDVCYIEVRKDDVSDDMKAKWRALRDSDDAHENSATDPVIALDELARGKVRRSDKELDVLFIPVMGLRTTVEDRWASWACLFSDARKLVMAFGFFRLDDSDLIWGVLYGIAAAIQACCQREVAEQYIVNVTAQTDSIIWFRRLAGKDYPGVVSVSLEKEDPFSTLLAAVRF